MLTFVLMPPPNEHIKSFPEGISITRTVDTCTLSPNLTNLFIKAHQDYDWPSGTGATKSQSRIIELENYVRIRITNLNRTTAHEIVIAVSEWAGNNRNSHLRIMNASFHQQELLKEAISYLLDPATAKQGIDTLSTLPGIRLVIATKIYRFCCPTVGASLDRHASYFFNSLRLNGNGFATNFSREWSGGKHTSSRLAIYQNAGHNRNRNEYFQVYLPLLTDISLALNEGINLFHCKVTGSDRQWTPADIEMAAYYWWACNGAR